MSEHVLTGAESDLTATDPKVYVCKFDDLNKNLNLVKFILAFSVPSGSDDMFTKFLHQKLLFTVDRNKPAVLKDGRSDFNFSNITKLNLIKQ